MDNSVKTGQAQPFNIGKLILAILIPVAVGGISGFVTAKQIPNWYATLTKPSFNPPNWLFGPVWTTLYILMGISLYMVWKAPESKERTTAITIFSVQLFLNFWWSIIFFSFHRIDIAMADIVLMWIGIAWMIVAFTRIKLVVGYLQIPYLLWVSFASALNAAILMLN